MGYEALRDQTLARQKAMGIVPPDTELPPLNPLGTSATHTGPVGEPFPALDVTRPWDSLSAEEQRLFSHMAEVYAGFLGHIDAAIGRLLDYLEQTGQRENTMVIVVSDNGASGEGGPDGSVDECLLSPARNRYVYYPGVAEVPESQAVNLRSRSFAIGALVDIPEAGAEGVLFAHGSRFGGHALYVKDNRLHYVNSFVGRVEQKIVSGEPLPTGEQLILSAAFDKEGEDPPGISVGTLSLFHGDVKVGEGRIKTQPGKFSIGGEGLCVGRDSSDPVTDDYPGAAPHAFTGGTINRVAVDVSGEPYVDLEREAVAMMSRE
jgi:hypothetical protein